MSDDHNQEYVAFAGSRQLAFGTLRDVASKAQESSHQDPFSQILIFDDRTGHLIEMDLRRTAAELSRRVEEIEAASPILQEDAAPDASPRGPGRPKLGVVAREVTLLPRHWDWLATQPGGASVALRKLVESARRTNQEADRLRVAREAAYRFISTMAGNEVGFEEAARALFAGDSGRFQKLVEPWPVDVARHAKRLAARTWPEAQVGLDAQTEPDRA
jgi:uncharacterized protein